MRTSLIITTYNWPDALNLCLASVASQSRMPDEIIVADDGSGPETAAVVRSWASKIPGGVRHVWQEDLGFRLARSRNRAIASATGEYVVVIDGDMVLHRKFVADHIACARPRRFIQGARPWLSPEATERMIRHQNPSTSPWMPGLTRRAYAIRSLLLSTLTSKTKRTLSGIQGCNQSFWRKDFLEVNGYDERFTGWGPEDREFAARLLNIGVQRLSLRHRAIAFHLHHESRAPSAPNELEALLAATLANGMTRCADGVDKHLNSAT